MKRDRLLHWHIKRDLVLHIKRDLVLHIIAHQNRLPTRPLSLGIQHPCTHQSCITHVCPALWSDCVSCALSSSCGCCVQVLRLAAADTRSVVINPPPQRPCHVGRWGSSYPQWYFAPWWVLRTRVPAEMPTGCVSWELDIVRWLVLLGHCCCAHMFYTKQTSFQSGGARRRGLGRERCSTG